MTSILHNLPTSDEMKKGDLAHHWHPFTDTNQMTPEAMRVITRAGGSHIWDSDGNQYLDAMAGLWCVNVGYGRERIAEAVARQMKDLAYYNTFFQTTHPPVLQLSQKLAGLTPGTLNRFFYGGSGSDAVDTALRTVRTYWQAAGKPQKTAVISRRNAYHGSTYAGVSLSGMDAMHGQGGPLIPDIAHIDQPYWFDEGGEREPNQFGLERARQLEQKIDEIGQDRVAAFFAEPVQGAGGVIIPPETYWPEIQRICREREILLVADEVICGFGRLGTWFGSTRLEIEPDLMTLAKGLSSGYLPIGAVAVRDDIATTIFDYGEYFHGYTYSGHPACCTAALENLAIMEEENLVERTANHTAPLFAEKWRALGEHRLVGEARSLGLVGALELVPDKPSHRRFDPLGETGVLCRSNCLDNGLIMRAVRDTMVVSPPLVITDQEIDELVDKAWRALDITAQAVL